MKNRLYDRLKDSRIDTDNAVAVVCVILAISVLAVPAVAQEGTYFSDDFESYDTGTFPASNYEYGSGSGSGIDAEVTDVNSYSGDKSIELKQGGDGQTRIYVSDGPFPVEGTNVSVMMLNDETTKVLTLVNTDAEISLSGGELIVGIPGPNEVIDSNVQSEWVEVEFYNITDSSFEVMWKEENGMEQTAGPFNTSLGESTEVSLWSNDGGTFDDLSIEDSGFEQPPTQSLRLDTGNYLEHGETDEYQVLYTHGNGTREDVSDDTGLNVTSGNTSVFTINEAENTLTATSDTSVNNRTTFTATYEGLEQQENVTVANVTVENTRILPSMRRVQASLSDDTVFYILIVALGSIVATRFAGAFAGIGFAQLGITIGWFIGYVSAGIAMVGLFTALFIGLNLAANIDYTVRR